MAAPRHDDINRLISNIQREYERDIPTDINDRSSRRRFGVKLRSALEAMRRKGAGTFLNFTSKLLTRNHFVAHSAFVAQGLGPRTPALLG
jgi:hypothetical protein